MVNGPDQDLASDATWSKIFHEIRSGTYDFVFLGTPCTTFSRARTGPPGPRPLRSVEFPYGFPKAQLKEREQKEVAQGTYFALQSLEACKICHQSSVGFGLESPKPTSGVVSIFTLPEGVEVARLPNVNYTEFDQCTLGAETAKPTRIMFWGIDLSGLQSVCNHPKQWWTYRDWSGRTRNSFSAHPPLAGRLRDSGEPATKAAAAYPVGLNLEIVKAVIARGRHSQAPVHPVEPNLE